MEGSYVSSDRKTSYEWKLPEWSDKDKKLCEQKKHKETRKPVVKGWMNYFESLERWYCACGRICWIKFKGDFVSEYVDSKLNGHIKWIESTIKMQELRERKGRP